MKDLRQIEGQTDFVRDGEHGAILNINSSEIQAARERKRLRKEKQAKKETLENEVDNLKKEMSDIKSLLSQLVEKL
jgi:predicted  nucleic acid-binding Zn-ribbon protein